MHAAFVGRGTGDPCPGSGPAGAPVPRLRALIGLLHRFWGVLWGVPAPGRAGDQGMTLGTPNPRLGSFCQTPRPIGGNGCKKNDAELPCGRPQGGGGAARGAGAARDKGSLQETGTRCAARATRGPVGARRATGQGLMAYNDDLQPKGARGMVRRLKAQAASHVGACWPDDGAAVGAVRRPQAMKAARQRLAYNTTSRAALGSRALARRQGCGQQSAACHLKGA
jgi:hypothetical protein